MSAKRLTKANAIKAIQREGSLLVFPVNNDPEPKSLWSVAHPRKKMVWEWDESGSDGLAQLWHLREELSRSRAVVYTKWYRGRATFFSLEVFQAILALSLRERARQRLSSQAKELLSILEEESPLSTKQLKRASGLVGRALEPTYHRAMQELWVKGLIVVYGEVDEGSFPSLAIGATRLIFEDLYLEAEKMPQELAQKILEQKLFPHNKWKKFFDAHFHTSHALNKETIHA